MKKMIFALVMAALGAQLLVAQTPTPAPETDPVIMKAGAIEIRQSEFEAALGSLPPEYQAYAQGPGRRQFAQDYLRLKILAGEALAAGLEKDPKVQAQLELLRQNTLANARIEKLRESIQVSEADVKAEYDKTKGSLERVTARHILVAFQGSPAASESALTEEAAKAKAEDLHKQIAAGADFAELAKAHSDDKGSGANGGSLGEFGRGQMVPEFENAVFAAKSGELTPVVRTQFGYHVIRVDSKSAVPFEQVREQIDGQIRQQKLQTMIEAAQTKAGATFSDSYFGPDPDAATPAATKP